MKLEVNKPEKSLEFYTAYYSSECNIPQSVDSNGKKYTLLNTQSSPYSWIERVRLIIITIFSFGTALFFAEVRKNWLMMLSNRKIEVRYKLNEETLSSQPAEQKIPILPGVVTSSKVTNQPVSKVTNQPVSSQPAEQKIPILPGVITSSKVTNQPVSKVTNQPVSSQPVEQKLPAPEIDYSEKIQAILNNNKVFDGYRLHRIGNVYFICNTELGDNIGKVAQKLDGGVYYIENICGARIDTESTTFQNKLQILHTESSIDVYYLGKILSSFQQQFPQDMPDCKIGPITIHGATLAVTSIDTQKAQYKIPNLPKLYVRQNNSLEPLQIVLNRHQTPVSQSPVSQFNHSEEIQSPAPEIDYSEKIQAILNNNKVFDGYRLHRIGNVYFICNTELGDNIGKVAQKLDGGVYYIENICGARIDTESTTFQNKLQILHNASPIKVCYLAHMLTNKTYLKTMPDCKIGSITIPGAVLMETETKYEIPNLPVWK
ncbi:MAG: hypothetical protein QRY74_05790 [Chlamydia sp.]